MLGLDSDARMNVPSKTLGNWSWRVRKGALTEDLAARLSCLVELTDRDAVLREMSEVKDADAEQQASASEQRKRNMCEQIAR
jgi:hypothetical protein